MEIESSTDTEPASTDENPRKRMNASFLQALDASPFLAGQVNPYVDCSSAGKRRRLSPPTPLPTLSLAGRVESGEPLWVPTDEPVTAKLNCTPSAVGLPPLQPQWQAVRMAHATSVGSSTQPSEVGMRNLTVNPSSRAAAAAGAAAAAAAAVAVVAVEPSPHSHQFVGLPVVFGNATSETTAKTKPAAG